MEQDTVNEIVTILIKLTGEVSKGQYENSPEIFEFTKEGL